jgi:hypothetical protein
MQKTPIITYTCPTLQTIGTDADINGIWVKEESFKATGLTNNGKEPKQEFMAVIVPFQYTASNNRIEFLQEKTIISDDDVQLRIFNEKVKKFAYLYHQSILSSEAIVALEGQEFADLVLAHGVVTEDPGTITADAFLGVLEYIALLINEDPALNQKGWVASFNDPRD